MIDLARTIVGCIFAVLFIGWLLSWEPKGKR